MNCYNCGQPGHKSIVCTVLDQQYTRCSSCKVVALSPSGHRITCKTPDFISKKIGAYELPFKDFHDVRFVFRQTKSVCAAANMTSGTYFTITKFLSFGPNIRFRRIYGDNDDVTLDLKMKPSITVGIGRKKDNTCLASIMFCDDQVRINHYQYINSHGLVTYNAISRPRTDEHHDVDLKLDINKRVLICSIYWNKAWRVNVAMSDVAVTVGPYNIENQ